MKAWFSQGRFWIMTALAFLFRSGRATMVLSIMVVTAVAALIFLSALSVGVNDAMLRNTVGLFSGHITATVAPGTVAVEDLKVAGVADVLRRDYLHGTLQRGQNSRPVTLGLLDPEAEKRVTAFHQTLVAGRYPLNKKNEILLSQADAAELGVKVGDKLRFTGDGRPEGIELRLAGLYYTADPRLDWNTAFSTADLLPPAERAWSAAIFLQPQASTAEVLARLRRDFGDVAEFESWETRRPDLRQLIELENISMSIVIVLVFGVVAIGIACSFIIFIIRNIREYGIIKAMGVTNRELSCFVVLQVLMMNGIASLLGLLFGVAAAYAVASSGGIDISAFTSHNQYFSVSGIILPRLTPFSLLTPPLTALFFSLAAALWPALLIVRSRPAEILRAL